MKRSTFKNGNIAYGMKLEHGHLNTAEQIRLESVSSS